MVVFDPVSRFLDFFAMAMGVNDQQDEDDDSGDEQYDRDGLVLPDVSHETGEIVVHPPQTYTCLGICQPLALRGRDRAQPSGVGALTDRKETRVSSLSRIHAVDVRLRNAEALSCAGKTLSHYASRFGESFRQKKIPGFLRVHRVSALNWFS